VWVSSGYLGKKIKESASSEYLRKSFLKKNHQFWVCQKLQRIIGFHERTDKELTVI
jgi:hypothetical protein